MNLANLVTWQSPKEALLVHRAKLEVFPASKVNHAKTVPKESIVKVKRVMVWVDLQIKLQILRNVSIVQLDGHQMKGAQNASLARLELLAAAKVKHVSRARKVSIVKVKRKMPMVILRKKVQMQRRASSVQLDGHQMKVAPSVNLASPENTVMSWERSARIVRLVTTGRLPLMLKHVQHVHRDTHKTKKVKHHGEYSFSFFSFFSPMNIFD